MSGKLTLISSATASGSSSVEFTSGIDSTYDEYIVYMVDVHPETALQNFGWQASTDGGSTYGMTITSTAFVSAHDEPDPTTLFTYKTTQDLAQSTKSRN